jgi:predicted O-methyltransferase YrrM
MKIEKWTDVPGWTCPRLIDLYEEIAGLYTSGTFVEVGVAYGRSLAFMATKAGSSVRLIGVDIFQAFMGGDNLHPDQFGMLKAYRTPMAAAWGMLEKVGAASRVELVQGKSADVAKILDAQADFVFIDAHHEYDSVREDILAWLPKVKRGGVIAGHDINGHYPGVGQAVREVLPQAEVRDPAPGENGWGGVWVHRVG